MTATATKSTMKQTSEMTKLNFITDQGSIRLTLRCALRVVLVALAAFGALEPLGLGAPSAGPAAAEPPGAGPPGPDGAGLLSSGDGTVMGSPCPSCFDSAGSGSAASDSGAGTASESSFVLSDIATLPLDFPLAGGKKGGRCAGCATARGGPASAAPSAHHVSPEGRPVRTPLRLPRHRTRRPPGPPRRSRCRPRSRRRRPRRCGPPPPRGCARPG